MIERYIVRYGKFGAYFFDIDIKQVMTLKQVEWILNYYHYKLKEKNIDI